MAEKSLANPVPLPPVAGPSSMLPAGTGTGATVGPKADATERGGALEVMVGRRGMEEEEEEEGKRLEGVPGPETEEREVAEKDGGMAWPGGTAADGGEVPLIEGGIMLGASSVGSSLPRTLSAMRNMARANCSAFSLPLF